MPTHFHKKVRCKDCGRISTISIPDLASEDSVDHHCPFCGSDSYEHEQEQWRKTS